MSRYIAADKLCQKILDAEDYYKTKNNNNMEARIKYDFLINVVTPMVAGTPTEDVAPVVHAHWEKCQYGMTCSSCKGFYISTEDIYDYRYCPHCGAKMDEENEKK